MAPDPLPPGLDRRAGIFVSLHREKELRGCVGTPAPVFPSVAEETIQNGISAAVRDPRFPPLSLGELEDVSISVALLSPLEPAPSEACWDVGRYGVVVDQGSRRGVLLPAVEGVTTAPEQIEIACRKAGIDPKSSFHVYLFQVERYEESEGG